MRRGARREIARSSNALKENDDKRNPQQAEVGRGHRYG